MLELQFLVNLPVKAQIAGGSLSRTMGGEYPVPKAVWGETQLNEAHHVAF
jgi:hypothetical protein